MKFFYYSVIVLGIFSIALQLSATLGGSFDVSTKTLSEIENTSFYLEKISFTADIPFSKTEFDYLVSLEPNTFVNKSDVQRAYRNLMRTQRFNNISINLLDGNQGKHLEFRLEGQWLLSKVKVTGFLFGKYEYGAQYLQQPGDVFDGNLHDESMQNIQRFLNDQGYFDGLIDDELNYNAINKTILVRLRITHGKRYYINSINITHQTDPVHAEAVNSVINKTQHEFKDFFSKHAYDKEYLKKIALSLKAKLVAEGFEQPRITMKKSRCSDHKLVNIAFIIEPGSRKIIYLIGNKVLSSTIIKEKILGDDQPNWLFSPDIICEQIIHEYERRGFIGTTVTHEKENDVNTFTIHEGTPAKLESIEVKHANTLAQEDSSYFWRELIEKDFFDQSLFDQKLHEFKRLYEKNGYWDFTIVDQQNHINELSGKLIVTIFINKGIQRLWGGFEVKGHQTLESLPGFKKFHLRNNHQHIPFNQSWLSEQKNLLIATFQEDGYWHANVNFELQEEPLASAEYANKAVKKVFVSWNIEPGTQITFGKVTIRGNTKLPFDRIKNEIKFQEGDVWNKEKIDLTRKKLKRLDVFKRVQVQPHQGNTKRQKPVIITIADDDPFEVRLRAGVYVPSDSSLFKSKTAMLNSIKFTEEIIAKVGASAIVKNPTNRADKITFDTDLSKFERKFNLEYQQPSLFNIPLLGKIKLYANEFTHPLRIASSPSAFQADQVGGIVALNEEYKDHFFFGLNLGNEWIKTSNVTGNIRFDPTLLNRYMRYVFIEPNIIIDQLDDKINTTRGTFSLVACKLMLPTSIADYSVRIALEQSAFYPLYEDIIIAGHVRFGHIFRRLFETIMPIERFFLGGPNSVRGYEKDSLPPIGTSTKTITVNGEEITTTEYSIQGGSSMFNANLEVRFPIISKRLQGVVFQDIGALGQAGTIGLTKSWYPATGFGLRLKTPVGPLRFDLGWKWKKRFVNDSNYAWYLTLGEAF